LQRGKPGRKEEEGLTVDLDPYYLPAMLLIGFIGTIILANWHDGQKGLI
jgi:hypothetical protein